MNDIHGDNTTQTNIEYEKMKQQSNIAQNSNASKFLMFFAGLIFAIISFAGAHPIEHHHYILQSLDFLSLLLLFVSGTSILDLLNFSYSKQNNKSKFRLFFHGNYFRFFFVGILSVMTIRFIATFFS